jgi:uncharacterized membrane protein SpoIIM required for sporulation
MQNLKSKVRMNRFIDERKDNWQRLEDLLTLLQGTSLRNLSKMEVREFGELYRRAAADLAIARAESRDPKLVNYLNSLVIRAHGKIYRAEGEGMNIISSFFLRDLPRTFRANWKYMAIAVGTFWVFAVFGFIVTWRDIGFTHFVYLSNEVEAIQANDQWWLSLNKANQIGSSMIMTNNILVTFKAFIMGALLGVGSFYDLAFEGARLGSIFAACYKLNPPFGNSLASFVIGHGVVELSSIWFAGAAGMMVGYSIINPGDLSRIQALKKKGLEAIKIVIGCACFLVVTGVIEGFISPSSMPPAMKIATGLGSGLVMYAYLFLVGRVEDAAPVSEA